MGLFGSFRRFLPSTRGNISYKRIISVSCSFASLIPDGLITGRCACWCCRAAMIFLACSCENASDSPIYKVKRGGHSCTHHSLTEKNGSICRAGTPHFYGSVSCTHSVLKHTTTARARAGGPVLTCRRCPNFAVESF